MWDGWLAGLSAWALLTLIFVGETLTCGACWNWFGIFIPTYILLFVFYATSCWSVTRYRGAFLDKELVDAKTAVGIARQRRNLGGECGSLLFSFVLTSLLVAFFIMLPWRLENGASPSWGAVFGVLIAIEVLVLIYAIAIVVNWGLAHQAGNAADWECLSTFGVAFACCRMAGGTPATYDEVLLADTDESRGGVEDMPPVCLGHFSGFNIWVGLYNAALFVTLVLFIIITAFLIGFANSGSPSLVTVLTPAWIALALVILTAAGVVISYLAGKGRQRIYEIVLLAFFQVFLIFVLIFTILLLETPGLSPHALLSPLYAAFGLAFLFLLFAICVERASVDVSQPDDIPPSPVFADDANPFPAGGIAWTGQLPH